MSSILEENDIVLDSNYLPLQAMFTDFGYILFDLKNNFDFVVHVLNKDFYSLFQPKLSKKVYESTKPFWGETMPEEMMIKYNAAIDESVVKLENEFYIENKKYMKAKKSLIEAVFLENCPFNVSKLERYFAYQLSLWGLNAPSVLEHSFTLNIAFDSNYDDYKDDRNFKREIIEIIYSKDLEVNKYKSLLASFERHDKKATAIKELTFSNGLDVFDCILFDMIEKNINLKQCPNCGKYFVSSHPGTIYCNNISPQDESKTCREYGKYRDYLEKNRTDEATKLYRSIYNTMQNKSRRCNYKNTALIQAVEEFKKCGNRWRADIKDGRKTNEEFIEWLKSVKDKKVL